MKIDLKLCCFCPPKYKFFERRVLCPQTLVTAPPHCRFLATCIRGGVEDTRLKAKETKKIRGQGQGQPFRGQTLSRPRTQAQAFSKKKRSSKIFFRRSPIHWRTQNFDWGKPKSQITWNDVIKIFSKKKKFLWDKDIAEWKIWNRCLFARNQDFAKVEGLN